MCAKGVIGTIIPELRLWLQLYTPGRPVEMESARSELRMVIRSIVAMLFGGMYVPSKCFRHSPVP